MLDDCRKTWARHVDRQTRRLCMFQLGVLIYVSMAAVSYIMFALWADVGRLSQHMSNTQATDEISTQLWKHEQDSGHRRKSVAVLCGCDTSSISLLLCSHWREVPTSVSHDKSKTRIIAKHDVCVRCVKPCVSYGFPLWRCDQGYRALQKHGMCDGVEYTNSIRIENILFHMVFEHARRWGFAECEDECR